MNNYVIFSQHYDELMGDRVSNSEKILKFIKESNITGKDFLDVACGTGSTLKYFLENGFNVTGIDISEDMLNLAKNKLPNVHFEKMNMTELKLNKSFDVITCLYDSVNHLLSFDDWKKFFDESFHHLNLNGLFIFDINTLNKLEELQQESTLEKTVGDKTFIMKVTTSPEGIYNWNIQIIKRNLDNSIEKYEENIKETSFRIKEISDYLLGNFKSIKVVDIDGFESNDNTKRVYFICEK